MSTPRPSIVSILVASIFFCFLVPAFSEGGTNWIARTITSGARYSNIDVMAAANGEIIVGYNAIVNSAYDVNIARLPFGSESFQYRTETGVGEPASFAADSSGNVFYALNDNSGIRFGQDNGGQGSLPSSVYIPNTDSALDFALPSIGVNPTGMPTVAYIDGSGTKTISTLSPYTPLAWQSESLASLGLEDVTTPLYREDQSLTFDASGNPVLSYVQRLTPQSSGGPLVVAVKQDSTWQNVANDQTSIYSGTSVAAAPNGSIGFAYVDEDYRLLFNSYGGTFGTPETLGNQAWNRRLSPNSLAYDAEGNPALVYGIGSTTVTPLHLMRRDSLGVWTDETLPIDSSCGSLTFDHWGNPVIAAATYSDGGGMGVTLLTKPVPEPGSLLLAILAAWILSGYSRFGRRASRKAHSIAES